MREIRRIEKLAGRKLRTGVGFYTLNNQRFNYSFFGRGVLPVNIGRACQKSLRNLTRSKERTHKIIIAMTVGWVDPRKKVVRLLEIKKGGERGKRKPQKKQLRKKVDYKLRDSSEFLIDERRGPIGIEGKSGGYLLFKKKKVGVLASFLSGGGRKLSKPYLGFNQAGVC